MLYFPVRLAAFGVCLVLAGCGASSGGPRNSLKYEYEYVSPQQQTLEEVLATPTSFRVNSAESALTWKRAVIFMQQYVQDESPNVSKQSGSTSTLTGSGNAIPYVFRVTKSVEGGNVVRFSVQCYEKKGTLKVTQGAKRNAHNLARFLTTGQLERSYLTQES